jgi:transcriptional regulator with XRE-family HTH domain
VIYSRADLISLSVRNNAPVAAIDLGEFDLDTLGGRVAFLRVAKGWKGAELARKCEFSQNTIWSLENNKIAEPSARLLWAVARALETTPEYLWVGQYDPDEAALVAAFRLLPPEQRPAVLRAAGVSVSSSGSGDPRQKKH